MEFVLFFVDVTPCGSCKNRRCVLRFLVTANVDPSSPILVSLMMEAIRSYKTSVLTRATRSHTSEDGILHSNRRVNLKSYSLTMLHTIAG
jgi:hypothetical protein